MGTNLVEGAQVAVAAGEGRVDLHGPGIATESVVEVVHGLQRVAHVVVRLRENWVLPATKPQATCHK